MNIKQLKKQLLSKNPNLETKIKKDLAFQVAKHFEEARLLRGLTQKELAKKIGTNQSNIARTESGASLPSLSFLKKVAEAMGTYLIPPKFAFMEKQRITVTYTLKDEKNYQTSHAKTSDKFIPTPFIEIRSIAHNTPIINS